MTPQKLPHNPEAEKSVIGAVLFDYRCLGLICEHIGADDFYHPTLQAIFEAMIELDRQCQPIDIITVAEQMRLSGTLDKLKFHDGPAYLAGLANQIATVEGVGHHARLVRQVSDRRRLLGIGGRACARALDDKIDVATGADETQQEVFELLSRGMSRKVRTIQDVLKPAMRALEQRYSLQQAVTGVPTGFDWLDQNMAGLQDGDLIVVAARPSHGKTTLACNLVETAAGVHGIPCLEFSLEMSAASIVGRHLCSLGKVDAQRYRAGQLTRMEWSTITQAVDTLSQAPIWIDDASSPTAGEIRAKARAWVAAQRRDQPGRRCLITVDYFQLIKTRGQKGSTRDQELGAVGRELKALAKELQVPLVVMAQLNRQAQRGGGRPTKDQIRECGSLEADADVILFPWRPGADDKDLPQTYAELILEKQRNGPTGITRVTFDGGYNRFLDKDPGDLPEKERRR